MHSLNYSGIFKVMSLTLRTDVDLWRVFLCLQKNPEADKQLRDIAQKHEVQDTLYL